MLRKIGKTYYVDISHPSLKKRMRFTTRTSDKDIAQQIHDSIMRDILENSISGYYVKKISLQKFQQEFISYSEINHSPKTTETYQYAFSKLNQIIKPETFLKDITVMDIENLKRIIPNKTTFNIYYNHLKAAFNYAIKWKYIKFNPISDVNKFKINEKTRRDIHRDEFTKLIEAIVDDNNLPFAKFLVFMFITGCRRKELLNLEWSDIYYDQNYFILKNTKGKRDAFIPLNNDLTEILKSNSSQNKPFNFLPSYITHKFKDYCRSIGLPEELVLHSTRHATTTILFEMQEHPLIIQNLIRHKDLKTTMNYTHTSPGFLRPAIDKTSAILKQILPDNFKCECTNRQIKEKKKKRRKY